jgi:hypothetical protein
MGRIPIVEPRTTAWQRDLPIPRWDADFGGDTDLGRHRETADQVEPASDDQSSGSLFSVPERVQQNRLRGDVVDRLALACRRLARHRADREWERSHPISQHMVVFLYCEPGHADTRDRLRVATRIFLAGDDVADLRRIVSQLYALSNEYRAMGRFDPRDQLSTRVERMSGNARYLGLGVATVDPYDIPRQSTLPDERSFRAMAMLDDGTKMVSVSSGGQGSVSTESTHTLDVGSDRTRTWGWARTLFLKDESEIARTGAEVLRLNDFILDYSQADLLARGQHDARWWRRW